MTVLEKIQKSMIKNHEDFLSYRPNDKLKVHTKIPNDYLDVALFLKVIDKECGHFYQTIKHRKNLGVKDLFSFLRNPASIKFNKLDRIFFFGDIFLDKNGDSFVLFLYYNLEWNYSICYFNSVFNQNDFAASYSEYGLLVKEGWQDLGRGKLHLNFLKKNEEYISFDKMNDIVYVPSYLYQQE